MNIAQQVGQDIFQRKRISLATLVLSNLFPLFGFWVFGWSIQGLLLVYWLESGVVGLLNIPKILLAHGAETPSSRSEAAQLTSGGRTATLPDPPERVPDTPAWRRENRSVAVFFTKHYGLFWICHGVFIGIFPLLPMGMAFVQSTAFPAMILGFSAFGVSHYVSYRQNYLDNREWQTAQPGRQINAPYSRVVLMHLTIIFGALVMTISNAPTGVLVVMIILKTALDVRGHLREHSLDSPLRPDPT